MAANSTIFATVDVNQLVGDRKIGFFQINLLFWAFVAMLADGFDMQVMPYIATSIVGEFQVNRAALGPVFSASYFGVLVGAPMLGVLGDHYGRKVGVIISLVICAVFMAVTMTAGSLNELMIYRFLTGVGIGGVFPNIAALVVEFSPKRTRAAFVIITIFGLALGTMVPAYAATALVPTYGWRAVFLVGGILPVVVVACLCFGLPESIKYLALRNKQSAVYNLVRKFDPSLPIGPETRFVASTAVKEPAISPVKLFAPGLASITVLIWIMCFLNLSTSFLFASWVPVLLQGEGLSLAQASSVVALFFLGGMFGGAVHLFTIDRFGALPIMIMFVAAAPLVACFGLVTPGSSVMMALALLAGSCMMGGQYGINALPGLIYPTAIRGNGAGWAQAIGRAGSSLGPIIGGLLVGMKVPLTYFFLVPAIGLLLGALAAFVLMNQCVRRFGSYGLQEEAASDQPELAPGAQAVEA
jgi:AAHS family 4-hydroxybenzoate transporter-like MFS transporter